MNWKKDVEEFKASLKQENSRIVAQAIRFGFFGSVGGGKSVTAGIFMVGINPKGKYGWIDGEGKRSGWAIDSVAEMAAKKYGGTKVEWVSRFTVIHIDPPFNPLRVVAAMEILEEAGCDVIALDLLSQCWDSDGGYLDMRDTEIDRMAGDDASKRNRVAASAAAHVKPWTHGKLVNKINASKSSLVLLFQAKQKWNAKASMPDAFITPIQESGLTRTAIAVGRVDAQMLDGKPCGGFCTFSGAIQEGTKFTHPSILAALPKNGEQFKFEHAEAIARLVSGSPQTQASKPTVPNSLKDLKRQLWDMTQSKHGGDKEAFKRFLVDECIIDPADNIEALSEHNLTAIITATKKKLQPENLV